MYPKDSRANPKSVQELRTLAAEYMSKQMIMILPQEIVLTIRKPISILSNTLPSFLTMSQELTGCIMSD
jgi:hypothetical protein